MYSLDFKLTDVTVARYVVIFRVDDLILNRYWNAAQELAIWIDSEVDVYRKLGGKAVSSSYDPSGKSENWKKKKRLFGIVFWCWNDANCENVVEIPTYRWSAMNRMSS